MTTKGLQPSEEILEAMQRRGELPEAGAPSTPAQSHSVKKGSNATSHAKPKLDPKMVAAVWRAMSQWFGHKWKSAYGEEPLDSWAVGLHGLCWEQIRNGLDCVRVSGAEWPPGCPEFRALCLGPPADDGAAVAASMAPHRALPVPPEVVERRKKTAELWIKKCRAILAS